MFCKKTQLQRALCDSSRGISFFSSETIGHFHFKKTFLYILITNVHLALALRLWLHALHNHGGKVHYIEKNLVKFYSKKLKFFSTEERKTWASRMTWRWVNYQEILIWSELILQVLIHLRMYPNTHTFTCQRSGNTHIWVTSKRCIKVNFNNNNQ